MIIYLSTWDVPFDDLTSICFEKHLRLIKTNSYNSTVQVVVLEYFLKYCCLILLITALALASRMVASYRVEISCLVNCPPTGKLFLYPCSLFDSQFEEVVVITTHGRTKWVPVVVSTPQDLEYLVDTFLLIFCDAFVRQRCLHKLLVLLDSLLVQILYFQLFLYLFLVVTPDDIRVSRSETQKVLLLFCTVMVQEINCFVPAKIGKILICKLNLNSLWLGLLFLLESCIERFLLCLEESHIALPFVVRFNLNVHFICLVICRFRKEIFSLEMMTQISHLRALSTCARIVLVLRTMGGHRLCRMVISPSRAQTTTTTV